MKIVSTVSIIILLAALFGWAINQPQDAGPDVPEGKLNSLSFAPFWEGQGPMDEIFPSVAQLDSDLHLMSKKTHSIRTYASAEGTMPEIPALARKYGLTMIQGAWLGSVKKGNKLELDELIRSANANPDVVKRVIVGNEVLLRGDLEPEELIQYIREVKQAVKQPVSYADVWSMYMKYPELIKEVDFITIHILPYWEDEPIAVDEAPAHIERIYKHVQQEAETIAPSKPILIGESGWPSEGRQRGWAVPGVVNEAKFIRGLIKVANANGFDYNIVEAINQSWKSELEGVVGANWGLFSIDREEVFPLTGKVYENPHWYKVWMIAIAIFVFAVAVCWKPLRILPILPMAGFLLLWQILALLWANQAELLWYTSYTIWQRLFTLLVAALNAVLAGLLLQRAYIMLAKQATNEIPGNWLYRLYLIFCGFFVFKTFFLAINGRYISFPILTASIPVIGVLGLMLIHYATKRPCSLNMTDLVGGIKKPFTHDKRLGFALLVTGFALVLGETLAFLQSRDLILAYPELGKRLLVSLSFTLTNQQLAQWLICLVILALPLLVDRNKAGY
ncbi:MAG: exo-beta-1,3-glucanase [Methylovulum sp.]|uniref:glycoside hydrolase family 17 protein n=1 Tax=Methylovulum sp. TaxID=1916980 RepID=UPI00263699FA|nr:exo-beta-1,3-glucanase [Methylovulum sp.]MDD2723066.1 exo-beta-1,3-glucanase [Methylovulum sp.]MDD5123745.1 exo-beta-1,3-glucanase [Methylovulum sp.]